MRQVLRTLIFLAATSPVAMAGDSPALVQAKEKLAAKDLKAAASLLEDALGARPSPPAADRKAMVDLLKETYRGLIRDATAAGSPRVAAAYQDDLAILDASSPDPTLKPAAAPPPAVAAAPAAAPAPAPAPPPAAAPAPAATPPPAEVKELPRAEGEPEARPLDLPLIGPAPDATAPTSDAPADLPAPRTSDSEVDRASAQVPEPTPAAPDELAQADGLFKEKKYDEAGKLYAGLARQGRLPAVRNKVWAYCRWSAIVARINSGPKSKAEWDLIEREIQSVDRLTPDHWFVDYLRDLVADTRAGKRPVPKGPGLAAVRGAEPEEEPDSTAPRPAPVARRPKVDPRARQAAGALDLPVATDDLPAPAPTPPPDQLAPPLDESAAAPAREPAAPAREPAAPARASAAPAQAQAQTAPITWQVLETASFRVHHVDAALAQKAGEAAEAVRASQGKRWGSPAAKGTWEPKCDVYLYPTPADFARMTGQPETSPGFSTMGIGGGKVVARRVNLRADHPQLIAAVLPHEVTHVVLADVFPDQQVPRWADEGMAVLAEPAAEQAGRCSELGGPLAENQVFPLETLMTTDYPDAKDWNLYYAQSVSLTSFLMAQGTPAQFVAFVKDAQQRGPDTALRATYRIAGFKDLDMRWRDHARREADRLATAADDPASTTR